MPNKRVTKVRLKKKVVARERKRPGSLANKMMIGSPHWPAMKRMVTMVLDVFGMSRVGVTKPL
ncbi:hypothetical protein [Halomicrococcus sp. NG-SE-24]|uniref:hypothetical protein n=1 Tax=Halomicrococcus sp. NG-SE-24 TaxID=3436928 RepID=UPI003D9900D1